jgi:hypothetical protein
LDKGAHGSITNTKSVEYFKIHKIERPLIIFKGTEISDEDTRIGRETTWKIGKVVEWQDAIHHSAWVRQYRYVGPTSDNIIELRPCLTLTLLTNLNFDDRCRVIPKVFHNVNKNGENLDVDNFFCSNIDSAEQSSQYR